MRWRRWRLRCGVRGGAVHDDARGEIAGAEIGIRLLFLRHQLVDLISKDASFFRDQIWKRLRLHFATARGLPGRSFQTIECCPQGVEFGHVGRRYIEVRERRDSLAASTPLASHISEAVIEGTLLRNRVIWSKRSPSFSRYEMNRWP